MQSLRHIAFALIALSVLLSSCRHRRDLSKTDIDVSKEPGNPVQEKLGVTKKEIRHNKLYSFVGDWYGAPYKYGGCQKSGVDCSCFTILLYQQVYSVKVPRTAGEIYKECEKISADKMKQGDLVFFKIKSSSISHVGVYLKNNKFVHASTSKGVIISDLNESYYKKYFHSAGRLKHQQS